LRAAESQPSEFRLVAARTQVTENRQHRAGSCDFLQIGNGWNAIAGWAIAGGARESQQLVQLLIRQALALRLFIVYDLLPQIILDLRITLYF